MKYKQKESNKIKLKAFLKKLDKDGKRHRVGKGSRK
jgi:hypothetical protein